MRTRRVTVAVIGRSGHAARLIGLVRRHPAAELACAYHPKAATGAPAPLTNDFREVLAADAVIVASPTPTHAAYLRRLAHYRGLVLVEKPAASTAKDVAEIRKWSRERKSRVRINYNLAHSRLLKHLSAVAASPALGRPVYLDVHISYGPAFKPEYAGNWRTDRSKSLGALESIGVHFINLAARLFGAPKDAHASIHSAARRSNSLVDTGLASFQTTSGVYVNLFFSHAAPFYFRMHLLGTNGYWEYDGRTARLHSPRTTYHRDGSFAPPPLVKKTALNHHEASLESLRRAVDDFLRTAKNGGRFDVGEFDLGLAAMDPLLGIRR
ncbi:MAG: Gfo/Idh/MocA family oxidoreductase [Elusimicrobia bacterium]|nr:Gfo/Idh/MocA family oxidoreductase [Elusimicrobiota bacterium]